MLNARAFVRNRGVTLIELMVAVAVVAIILSIGVPSFQTFLQNTRLRSTAEAALNGMQLARNESVRRNGTVRFVLGDDLGWSVMAGDETIQTRQASEGSDNVDVDVQATGATTISFNGLGRVVANADDSASLTQISLESGSMKRRIDVQTGGLVRLCDPDVIATGDPRKC